MCIRDSIRTTFASNLLASGGIEAVNPGTVDADGVAAAVADAGSPSVAVLLSLIHIFSGCVRIRADHQGGRELIVESRHVPG